MRRDAGKGEVGASGASFVDEDNGWDAGKLVTAGDRANVGGHVGCVDAKSGERNERGANIVASEDCCLHFAALGAPACEEIDEDGLRGGFGVSERGVEQYG